MTAAESQEPGSVLAEAWRSARAGAGAVVALCGDPGMGKSYLLGQLAERVRADSGEAVWAAPERRDGYPAQLMTDVVDALGEHTDGYLLDDRELGRVLRDLLARRCAARPMLLVLDDLHAADAVSLRVLRQLVNRRPPPGLLLLLAYRPRQASTALVSALNGGAARIRRVVLGPVSAARAATILGVDPGAPVAAAHRFCAGNPLYLTALAGPDLGGALSQGACLELTRDLADLSLTTQLVARGLAVAGESWDVALLAGICDLDDDRVLHGVDELVAADIIRLTGDSYAFRHPLLEQAVLETSGAGWRNTAGNRALQLLRRRGARPEDYVRHLEWLAVKPDETSAEELAAAGRAVLHDRPALAARWFGLALKLLPDHREHRRAELRLACAEAELRAGRLRDAYTRVHDVLRSRPRDPDAAQLGALAERLLGRRAEAAVLLRESVPGAADPRRAELVIDLALTESGARPDVLDGVRRLGTSGSRSARVAGHAELALHALITGQGNPAGQLDEAVRLVDRLPDAALADRLDRLIWLCEVELRLEQHALARRHSQRAAVIARDTGQPVALGMALTARGAALGWLGKLAEAADAVDAAIETLTGPDCDHLRGRAVEHRAWLAALAGDTFAAVDWAEQSVDLLGQEPDGTRAALRLVGWKLAAGVDPEADARRFLRLAGGPELPVVDQLARAELADALVSAALALGWTDRARMWAEGLVAQAAGMGLPGRHGLALRALARVMLVQGNQIDAVLTAKAAVELLDRVDAVHEAGMARSVVESAVAEAGTEPAGVAWQPGIDGLTNRELEIAELVSTGMTNAHIARSLRISEKTVEGHLTRIFDKLEIPSRAALASLLTRAQLVT